MNRFAYNLPTLTNQTFLPEMEIPFHTFSLPSERQFMGLLRGIPTFYTKDVKGELTNSGYSILHVCQFLKEERKPPLYMFTLLNTPGSKTIFGLTSIFMIGIKVEAYKKSGLSQCFKCQGFGHSSAHCNNTAQWINCSNDHTTMEYIKIPYQPPKFCNCEGVYKANYCKCQTYETQTNLRKKS